MRRRYTVPFLALMLALSGCGSSPANDPVSSSIPDRPTAYTLPTGSPTNEPPAPGDTTTNPSATTFPAFATIPAAATPIIDPTAPTVVPSPTASAPERTTVPIEPSPPEAPTPPTATRNAPTVTTAPPAPTSVPPTATTAPPTATKAPTARSTNTPQPTVVATTAAPTALPPTLAPPTAVPATATSAATPTPDIGAAEQDPTPQPTTTLQIEQPAEGSLVVAPLHVALSGAGSDERLVLQLIQADGGILRREAQARLGYVVTTLPGVAVPGPVTLEVTGGDGTVLARRAVLVAAPEETQSIKVAWLAPATGEIMMVERRIARTPQIASAAVSEMLWGPDPGDTSVTTSLPSSDEVLVYAGRGAGWGARVRLLKLTITDGTALVNLSPELRAYGGGSARVASIRAQIEATLRQFPSVSQVVIAINGETEGVLEP